MLMGINAKFKVIKIICNLVIICNFQVTLQLSFKHCNGNSYHSCIKTEKFCVKLTELVDNSSDSRGVLSNTYLLTIQRV